MSTLPAPDLSTAPEAPLRWGTGDLLAALRARYAAPEYAFLTEVANGTGSHCSRHADALAMSLWPSRGLEILGFEIKASRGDWKRELQIPAKAEAVAAYCDRWYVVVADLKIVAAGELPLTWGLIAPKGGKLVIAREAPPQTPKPVGRPFLAALFRSASESSLGKGEVWRIRAEVEAEAKAAAEKRYEGQIEALKQAAERARLETVDLRAKIRDFQDESGFSFDDRWTGGKTPRAVRLVLAGELNVELHRQRKAIETQCQAMELLADRLRAHADQYRQVAADALAESEGEENR